VLLHPSTLHEDHRHTTGLLLWQQAPQTTHYHLEEQAHVRFIITSSS
jgi:hypothetical protein